ncbi:MAG: heme-dependent peroxidase [Bryobacterales bacterium]|nr:heme-dependent peroxidase [Bryobacterales bacterium]
MVPYTLEGAYLLHQMFRIRWSAWKSVDESRRRDLIAEMQTMLSAMQEEGTSLYSMVGHKGDLLFLHFRPSLDALNAAELKLAQTGLADYFEPTNSYVSIVELGLYESTQRINRMLAERGLQQGSAEWDQAANEELDRSRAAMAPRLFPETPPARYLCFYPMDRRRGEEKNWYQVPLDERARMMHEHGMVGRKYAGIVKQIISGSIGLDDWEWGVDLWADDPVQFKKLIYEMRFDEVSAIYALFGQFFICVRTQPGELDGVMSGRRP